MGRPATWRYDALRLVRRTSDGSGDAPALHTMPEAAEGGEMRLVNESDLWYLQVAARQWLREHPEDPNGPTVRAALLATNEPDTPNVNSR